MELITTPTNKQQECYQPIPRPKFLVAYDIIDKLEDLEAEIACQVLKELITNYEEVQTYIVENYIDLITEEEDL